MKKLLLAVFAAFFASFLFAQSVGDSIAIKKVFLGHSFSQHDQNLKMKDLLNITKINAGAYEQMKKARTSATISNILAGVGGFLVGYTIGTSIGGKTPNWAVAGVGAGLIGVAVPISIGASNRAKKGVEIFNSGLR